MPKSTGLPLTEAGLRSHADALSLTLPIVWAVLDVETSGCGFLPDGRPTILFERHVFRRLTRGRFDAAAPDLSNATPGGYGPGGAHQHDRLSRAMALDRTAALNSASWGLGQIMGFNARTAGFADVEDMVAAMTGSEDQQLGGMFEFLHANDLDTPLRNRQWDAFAKRYNGPAFAKNAYDARLGAAFDRFTVQGVPDVEVRAAQMRLRFRGYRPGKIDGRFGNKTREAVLRFQADAELPLTGALDPATTAALSST